jgi:hypothetical protein
LAGRVAENCWLPTRTDIGCDAAVWFTTTVTRVPSGFWKATFVVPADEPLLDDTRLAPG